MPSHLDLARGLRARVRGIAESGLLELVGALFHHRSEVAHPDWPVPWANQEQMLTTRRRLLIDSTSPDAQVVYTHEPFPLWGLIVGYEVSGHRRERA